MSDSTQSVSNRLAPRTFLLLLAAALLAAFPETALGIRSLFFRDFGALGYPGTVFTRDCLFNGEFPLWNPYSHCGVPWLAQMGQWYPPSWLCYVLPLPWAENFLVLTHLWLGGVGMFWLLRRWNRSEFAAGFAAFAFVFNGVTLSCTQWGNYIASLAWLPWVVGCVIGAWRQGGHWLALGAIAAAMQVLTATPELTLLTWIFIGLLWISDLFSREVRFVVSASRISPVIVLAAGITMIQMLPFFDLLAHSQRDAANADSTVWAMPAWGWANWFVPLFHCYQSPQGIWFQRGQDFLISYYLGVSVVVLAVVGAFTRKRNALLVAAMILFCVLAASGTNGFLYAALRKIFPLIGIARFPVKFMILPAFLMPLLAARGLDEVLQKAPARRLLWIVAAAVLILASGLLLFARHFPLPTDQWPATAANVAWRMGLMLLLLCGICLTLKIPNRRVQIALQICVLAILPMDAFLHSPGIVPTLPASVLAPGIWEDAGRPALMQGQGRIMVSPNAEQELLYSRVKDMKSDFIGKRLAEWYNLNLLDGLPKVNGAVTLRPAHFDILEKYLYYTPGSHCGRGLVDFLSVAWLSSPGNPTEWIRRTHYLPLVTAGQKPIFADGAVTLGAITSNDFDPSADVYLPDAARSLVTATDRTGCSISHTQFSANEIKADIQASGPALIVLSQSYYHWWHVLVDGRPAPLLRANLAFQAVQVPAGNHRVEWIYRDPWLGIGAVISTLSLAICGVVYRRPQSGLPDPFDF